MKILSSYILSTIIFLASFQNSLIFLDYQINKDFYETHCINKDKPEMNCHGKCEAMKESEETTSPFNLVKIGFEFNILPVKNIEVPEPCKKLIINKQTHFYTSLDSLQKGYFKILPHPPQV